MKASEYFKAYPARNEGWQTSDGFFFFLESDAVNHGNKLSDKTVKKHVRAFEKAVVAEEADVEIGAEESAAKTEEEKPKKAAAKKAAAKKSAE